MSKHTLPPGKAWFYAVLIFFAFIGTHCQEEGEKDELPPKYLMPEPHQAYIVAGKTKMQTIGVHVLDADSLPKENVRVLFKINDGEVSLSATTATTDADGHATIDVSFGTKVGEAWVVAEVYGLEGSPIDFYFFVEAATPVALSIVSGNEQEGAPKTNLKDNLVVLLVDEFDNPVHRATIFFKVTQSDGELFWSSSQTNTDGTAYASFRLGSDLPVNKIEAYFDDKLKVVFSAYTLTPVKLDPVQAGKDRLTLRWAQDVNPTFERYVVYRSAEGSSLYSPIKTITDKGEVTTIDNAVVPGKNYWYYIRTETNGGNYVTSNYEKGSAGDYVKVSERSQMVDMVYDEPAGKIYISNQHDRRIIVRSVATLEKLDSIALTDAPLNLALSSDRKRLYVTLNGTGAYCSIDLATKAIVKQLDISAALGADIFDIYQASDGQLFVSSRGRYIVRIDEVKNTTSFAANLYTFNGAGCFIGDNGKDLIVTGSDAFIRVDLTSKHLELKQEVKYIGDINARMSLDRKRIYRTSGDIVDTDTFGAAGKLGYGGSRVAISKDGARLYAVSQGFVNVYNTSTQLLERKVPFAFEASQFFVNDAETEAIIQVNSDYPSPYFTRLYKLRLVD